MNDKLTNYSIISSFQTRASLCTQSSLFHYSIRPCRP